MKRCPSCNKLNDNDAIYCKYCAYTLKNADYSNDSFEYKSYDNIDNHFILSGYILAILLGWGGILLFLLFKSLSIGFIGFFGVILPFSLLRSSDNKVKMHGIIQIMIYISGFIVQLLLFFQYFSLV